MNLMRMNKVHYGLLRNMDLARRHMISFYRHNTSVKLFNLFSLYLQKWVNKSILSSHPAEIIIDPINICHLQCPLCPTGQRLNSRPKGKMTFNGYRRIIDELDRWLYKVRFYSWGEPLMHEDIYEMIGYAAEKNIGTEVSSHLNVLKENDPRKIVESGLETLIISLDGADEKTYSQYRIGGDFNRVIRNISAIQKEKKMLCATHPIIEIQFLVMRHNESQIPKMVELKRSIGVERLRFSPVTINIRNMKDWEWLPLKEEMSRYDYEQGRDKIYSHRTKCEWLWRSAVINWDETVSPCCVYEGEKADLGTLKGKTFHEIWNDEFYKHSREVFTAKGDRESGIETICSHCKGRALAIDEEQHGLF